MNLKTKEIAIILFLIGAITGYLYIIKEGNKEIIDNKPDFVRLHNEQLYINNDKYFPLTLNYKLIFVGNEQELWPTAIYDNVSHFSKHHVDKDSCLMQLNADLQLIKDMGFNSIRVVGIGEPIYSGIGEPVKIPYLENGAPKTLLLNSNDNYATYFKGIEKLLQISEKVGLRVIFLIQMKPKSKKSLELLQKLSRKFKDNSTILAYDFFNEPLYFDSLSYEKLEVYPMVKEWNVTLKDNSPHHLSTIGLAGIREVFRWDPNLLDIDFISYHPYEYEPSQVINELYWYGKYTNKPWMIGETSLPADNDSVSYDEQAEFAKKTLKQALDCGAIGYSWWQYKDVEWGDFHQNFMGIVSQEGNTTVNGFKIKGTPKKATVEAFIHFDPYQKKEEPIFSKNYYNYSQFSTFKLKGRLLDENNQPIEGGVVLVWNEWWDKNRHSVTRKDGSFEIKTDFEIYHWILSAPEKTYTRGDVDPATALMDKIDSIPSIDIGSFKVFPWRMNKNSTDN